MFECVSGFHTDLVDVPVWNHLVEIGSMMHDISRIDYLLYLHLFVIADCAKF